VWELRCDVVVSRRESLAFDERGDALLPAAPRGRWSRSYWSVAETERDVVVVGGEGAMAPAGNSSAESVAPSSSAPPPVAPPWPDEPFITCPAAGLLADSDDLPYACSRHDKSERWMGDVRMLVRARDRDRAEMLVARKRAASLP